MSATATADDAGAIVRQGHLRKLKTMKKKFFVLRAETPHSSAKLEYYESEKKFRAKALPRRVIALKSCYNITRRLDLKQKHVIALFTREEQFCVVAENEEELITWLKDILNQHSDDVSEELLRPIQHVWLVNVQKKGLGASKNIQGLYNLCLTEKTLTLVKIKSHNNVISDLGIPERIEYSLKNIRRCGDSECFFYMEVGRQTVTGAGELWMHVDDSNIAQSMHSTIYHSMRNCAKEAENEKDHVMLPSLDSTNSLPARRQTYSGGRTRSGLSNDTSTLRTRCDSMPSRTCAALESDRPPPRHSDIIEGLDSSRDETDSLAEWHRTPRIPEEPDYCEMGHKDVMSTSLQSRGTVEEAVGYLPMAPGSQTSPLTGLFSASSGSVCSGTPSTDPRFSEYNLAPATSHLWEEDERPARAYSVGSRPGAAARAADGRHRAYSVGARVRPSHGSHASHGSHGSHGAHGVHPSAHGPHAPALLDHLASRHQPGRSSSSAPLLPRTSVDDLMELDFSNNSTVTKAVAQTPPGGGFVTCPRAPPAEYVDMSPRADAGYVEMRPGEGRAPAPAPSLAPALGPAPAPAPAALAAPDGYVEMNYGRAATRPIAIAGARKVSPPAARRDCRDGRDDEDEPRDARTPLGSQTIFPLSLESPASPGDPAAAPPPLRDISEEGRRSPEVSSSPQYVTLAGEAAEAGEAGEADGKPTGLNYAALDLEPRGSGAASAPRLYTQIDFVLSEKLHAADGD